MLILKKVCFYQALPEEVFSVGRREGLPAFMNLVHVSPISTVCCTAANPDPRPAYQELVFILVLVCTLRYQTFHTSLVVPYSSVTCTKTYICTARARR